MNTTLIIGIILTLLGIRSIWFGISRKENQTGFMMPSQTFLTRKVFGEKRSAIFWNYFWGITELIMGIVIIVKLS